MWRKPSEKLKVQEILTDAPAQMSNAVGWLLGSFDSGERERSCDIFPSDLGRITARGQM